MKQKKPWFSFLSSPEKRDVIYGVTDRSTDSFFVSMNEWVIDHSPVKDKEKELMYSSLELLVRSGVKFTRAMHLLAKRSKNERLRRILKTMAYDMENRGMSFSSSMTKYPDIFDTSESKMIYSGEVTGKLEETLGSIAEQVQKNLKLRMQVRSALTYPIVVVFSIVLAMVIVLNFVIPRLKNLFDQFGGELPFLTQTLITISELFQAYWWIFLGAGAIAWSLFHAWKKTYEGQRSWDGFWLKAPLINNITNNIQTVRVAGNLSTLLQSGVSVPKAFNILGAMVPNKVVGDALFRIEHRMTNGDQMHVCFQEESVFDDVIGEVVEVGEKGGTVPEVLKKTSDQYQFELDSQLKNLMTVLEPLVIILVGAAVIIMAIAVLTPLLQLTELIQNG